MAGRSQTSRKFENGPIDRGSYRSAELMSVAYPKLRSFNSNQVRLFLAKYDDYGKEVEIQVCAESQYW